MDNRELLLRAFWDLRKIEVVFGKNEKIFQAQEEIRNILRLNCMVCDGAGEIEKPAGPGGLCDDDHKLCECQTFLDDYGVESD